MNLKFLFQNPKILLGNFFIWLFISFVPLLVSLMIQQIFNSLESVNLSVFLACGRYQVSFFHQEKISGKYDHACAEGKPEKFPGFQ